MEKIPPFAIFLLLSALLAGLLLLGDAFSPQLYHQSLLHNRSFPPERTPITGPGGISGL